MNQQERRNAEKALKKGFKNDADARLAARFLETLISEDHFHGARQVIAKTAPKCFEYFPIAHMAAIVCHHGGEYGKAAQYLKICTRLAPNDAHLHNELGQCLNNAGDSAGAVEAYRRAISLQPVFPDALSNMAGAWEAQGARDAAEQCYREALSQAPNDGRILYNYGAFMIAKADYDTARHLTGQALQNGYNHPDAVTNLAIAQMQLGLWDQAAQTLAPLLDKLDNHPHSLATAAALAHRMDDTARSNTLLDRCLAIDPGHEDALLMKAQALLKDGDYDGVIALAEKAQFGGAKKARLRAYEFGARQRGCMWDERYHALSGEIDGDLETYAGQLVEPPLQTTSRTSDPSVTASSARSVSHAISRAARPGQFDVTGRSKDPDRKIRLGYVSYDFRDHAIAHLTHRLYALHDRDRFQVFGFSAHADDGSAYRKTIAEGCDEFVDIAGIGAPKAAAAVHAHGIDILIDLNGHTEGNRLDVFAHRPAPLAMTWLGFPGTTGADFIDYIVVDRIVCPPDQARHLSETPIYMPHTYQCADTQPDIADISRDAAGVPDDKTVIACMNQSYKLDPMGFSCWMDIMAETPDTVLWLLEMGGAVEARLRAWAAARGVDPARLIFAPKVSKTDHLARIRTADFAVDTLIYNGHTTTRDHIECGVPVVTLEGPHFPSRVSSSLLRAYGLGDLVQADFDAYRAKIRQFATQPDALTAAKQMVRAQARAVPVSTDTFVRDLERAYLEIWRRHCSDMPRQEIVL